MSMGVERRGFGFWILDFRFWIGSGFSFILCALLWLGLLLSIFAGRTEAQNMQVGQVPAPRSFEAIAVSPTEIRCYWLPSAGATSYRVERDGQTVATLPGDAQEFADTGLAPDSTHRYTVRALANGTSIVGALTGETTSDPRQYTERTFAPFPGQGKREQGEPIQNPKSKIQNLFDVIIVQASSGGVAAAIEAARRGLQVALVEPTTRLGGMPANGLSATDLRRPYYASGFLARFRDRVQALYAAEGIKTSGLQYEPRVAHQAIKSLLWEYPNITVLRRTQMVRVFAHDTEIDDTGLDDTGMERTRRRVDGIEIEELNTEGLPTGRRAMLRGKVFVDATDCGDLAAQAGAPFRLGREPRSAKEPHNGVIYYDRATDKRLSGSTGKGDRRIQAYTYLLTVKDYGSGADKTIPKPRGYRREDFSHTPAWKQSWAITSGSMPGSKYELNQHPEGGDLQEINYPYPASGFKTRARIEQLYRDRVMSYLYYIQTEQGQKQVGLPDDEYRDSGGFPPLLYVREGRRILGEELPVEADITDARQITRPESIGIGDYPMDSHAVRPKTDWNRPDMGEGEWWLYRSTPWHELPLGVIVPQRLDNVFVTTAVSSTHVSFGTYRLEPVRMAFGQAAGIAALYCIRYGLIARDVPARQIQDELLPHASNPNGDPNVYFYYYSDVKPDNPHYKAIQYLSVRGFQLTAEDDLKPDAPTTYGELANWLEQLVQRAAPPERTIARGINEDGSRYVTIRRPFYPYMGPSANMDAVRELRQTSAAILTKPVTHAVVAHWLRLTMGWRAVPTMRHRYVDAMDETTRSDAAALDEHGIDSILWDGLGALQPGDGTVFNPVFNPGAMLNHAAMFETLYIAQLGLGPQFFDAPVDGKNGRNVPSALYETVEVPIRAE
jgi:hypothetical protein